MSADSPNGQMRYWFNGVPFGGVKLGNNDGGEMQFWFNGQPYSFLFPVSMDSWFVPTGVRAAERPEVVAY